LIPVRKGSLLEGDLVYSFQQCWNFGFDPKITRLTMNLEWGCKIGRVYFNLAKVGGLQGPGVKAEVVVALPRPLYNAGSEVHRLSRRANNNTKSIPSSFEFTDGDIQESSCCHNIYNYYGLFNLFCSVVYATKRFNFPQPAAGKVNAHPAENYETPKTILVRLSVATLVKFT
jgi:hypothetical protein